VTLLRSRLRWVGQGTINVATEGVSLPLGTESGVGMGHRPSGISGESDRWDAGDRDVQGVDVDGDSDFLVQGCRR